MVQIWDFLSTEGFQPHGMCLLRRPDVFWAHAASDAVIALSYFSIPVALFYFARRRPDLVYRRVIYMFCAFIVACGITHAFGLWTLWVPDYSIEGLIKIATAIISATTAILLWPLMPKMLAIPSAEKLAEQNTLLAREIAEREAAEAELRALNLQLLQSQTEAEKANIAKSEFLALMSHEVRTPLNGILATADLMAHKSGTGENHRFAELIQQSGQSLLTTVNKILDLSRIEAGVEKAEAVQFRLPDLIDEVKRLWETRFKDKQLDYSFTVADDVPTSLVGDPEKIREVLNNIINNAVKYTESGTIGVSVSVDEPESVRNHRSVRLRIDVSDTGTGIAPDKLDKIFERFEQGDTSLTRSHEGTGLGLTICREFCRLMDGDIGVSSAEGAGSQFWFTFRCATIDADTVASEDENREHGTDESNGASETGDRQRPVRILVAEDNATNQILLNEILRHFGHEFSIVNNGVEAVSALQEKEYDLVLMDIRMPVMDGLEATKQIRSLKGDIARVPIIALTAHAMIGDRERYMAAGMNGYISKPFTLEDIERNITKYSRVA